MKDPTKKKKKKERRKSTAKEELSKMMAELSPLAATRVESAEVAAKNQSRRHHASQMV